VLLSRQPDSVWLFRTLSVVSVSPTATANGWLTGGGAADIPDPMALVVDGEPVPV